jgi:dTDP-4-amino-4,6-dideoxygalactose transaminase
VVPVVDLSRRGTDQASEYAQRVIEIATRGLYLLGPETEAFEASFAAWLQPRRPPHVVAVSSGASALQLALAALGVGAGDEVIVPAFTAVPTASAVLATGAVPVPVDVEADTANLDPGLVAAARTDRTRAVIVVHLFGRPATLPDTDLPIVEDAAQAHGAVTDHGRSAATIYSFYPTKNLGGIGDGGAVVTHDPALADTVHRLRVHGMTAQYVHESISQNFRMSEVEAVWLQIGLRHLTAGNERRRAIAARYRDAAPQLAWQRPSAEHVHHLCVLRVGDREAARHSLASDGVATAVHYPLALTQQPAYAAFTRVPCPESEAWAASCVSVPCFPELTDREVDHVARALAALAASTSNNPASTVT